MNPLIIDTIVTCMSSLPGARRKFDSRQSFHRITLTWTNGTTLNCFPTDKWSWQYAGTSHFTDLFLMSPHHTFHPPPLNFLTLPLPSPLNYIRYILQCWYDREINTTLLTFISSGFKESPINGFVRYTDVSSITVDKKKLEIQSHSNSPVNSVISDDNYTLIKMHRTNVIDKCITLCFIEVTVFKVNVRLILCLWKMYKKMKFFNVSTNSNFMLYVFIYCIPVQN